jgi:hydroxymethylbilane synthase
VIRKNKIIVGTRGSRLALWQAGFVAELIEQRGGVTAELKIIKTKGDKILDAPLAKIGGKGLFVKEIENALLEGKIDLAVHSLKDVPTEVPTGLVIGAVIRREIPQDALISKEGFSLRELPSGSVVGTSSLRRKAQLLNYRPDLKVADVRGNLDTRLRKMEQGQFDAIIVAAAGLYRMGWQDRITELIPTTLMLGAVGQGAICVEMRRDDGRIAQLVRKLDHKETRVATLAERAFLRRLEGGCQIPIGALGTVRDGVLELDGVVANLSGSRLVRDKVKGSPDTPEKVGVELAELLINKGADKILTEVRALSVQ